MENKRTVRVTGKGRLKLRPDMTRITITLEKTFREYDETLRKSSESTGQLRELISECGFKGSDLKTLDFSIDTEYKSYTEHGEYKQRFAGYKFRHIMKIEFDSDNVLLGRILSALAGCGLHPEFRISYTVKDTEAAKSRLLGNAVKDAGKKAAVLAEAADVALMEILSVDYSWGEIEFETCPMDRLAAGGYLASSAVESCSLDIEPDDIDVSDTVTVIWEIQ